MAAERAETAASHDSGTLRQRGVGALRSSGLLPAADWARSLWIAHRSRRENVSSGLAAEGMPPAGLMYDAYGHTSWPAYLETGRADAGLYAGLIQSHAPDAKTVLEWGCGPARILRHMPATLPGAALHGADPNRRSIAWARRALPGITFHDQGDWPPLAAPVSYDAIYGVSVLTHLRQAQQTAWIAELQRLLTPRGVMILTTHGEACSSVLLPEEKARFAHSGYVERGGVQHGKRCFVTYHHPLYVRETLLKGWRILAHVADNPASHAIQDIWVAQKEASA